MQMWRLENQLALEGVQYSVIVKLCLKKIGSLFIT